MLLLLIIIQGMGETSRGNCQGVIPLKGTLPIAIATIEGITLTRIYVLTGIKKPNPGPNHKEVWLLKKKKSNWAQVM